MDIEREIIKIMTDPESLEESIEVYLKHIPESQYPVLQFLLNSIPNKFLYTAISKFLQEKRIVSFT